jgi:Flp pilus assembly pilin Flp
MFRKLLHDEKAQDLIEYALLGSFISVVSVVVVRSIGPLVNDLYLVIQDAMTTNSGPGARIL